MPKAFQTELAPQTSHRIYQQLLNVGTASARKCGGLRGKINKRPAFTQLGKLRTATDLECEPLPLQFYNFHYNTPRITDQSVKGEVSDHDFKTQYAPSPCPSLTDNTEEDSMVKMKKIRATSAFARNPESYNRNPELFLSCTPRERRQLNNYKPIIGNQSYQAMRYNKEWSAKVDCRVTKQSSELLKHRADKMYILNGSSLKLQHKYQVNDTEIQHLRELSKARQELKTDLRDAKEIISDSADKDNAVEMTYLENQRFDQDSDSEVIENQEDENQPLKIIAQPAITKPAVDASNPTTAIHAVSVNSKESSGVHVFDLLNHKTPSPYGRMMVELAKTSKQPDKESQSKRDSICEQFANTDLFSDGLIHVQPGEGSYSITSNRRDSKCPNKPYNKHNFYLSTGSKIPERLIFQKQLKNEVKNLTEICGFPKFPVRKQCYKLQIAKKMSDVCENCDPKCSPSFLRLKGRPVPLVSKS